MTAARLPLHASAVDSLCLRREQGPKRTPTYCSMRASPTSMAGPLEPRRRRYRRTPGGVRKTSASCHCTVRFFQRLTCDRLDSADYEHDCERTIVSHNHRTFLDKRPAQPL